MAMVIPAPALNLARLMGLLVLLAYVGVLAPSTATAQERFDFFWTLKAGRQTAETSGDTLIEDFEEDHGELQGEREVKTEGLEFDLVTFPTRRAGVGMGFEYHQYFKVLRFSDPAGVKPSGVINIKGRALLYTLKFYGRFGFFLPFLGLGSGIYLASYQENSLDKFLESSSEVFHGRIGARILMGKWSLLLEYGETRAPLIIQNRRNQPELDLGGTYGVLGIGRSF